MINVNLISGRTLAFVGDAEWSLIVRKSLVLDGVVKGKNLQKQSISYVSAKAQSKFYTILHEENFFTEEEEEWYHRGRNSNDGAIPKNTDAQTYRMSTGFETMIGALSLNDNHDRIREIWEKVKSI